MRAGPEPQGQGARFVSGMPLPEEIPEDRFCEASLTSCRSGGRSGYPAFPTSRGRFVGPNHTFISESYCSSFPANFNRTVRVNGVS